MVGRTFAHGHVADGFAPVADEFERNFAQRGEVGAAFAVYRNGERVVDLCGGLADSETGRRWDDTTLVPIFSGTKTLVAAAMLWLLDAGRVDLEEPVATYWPEFAARGKAQLLVRHVVSHTAGLPGVRRRAVSAMDVLDGRLMAALLADEEPVWEPGTTICYHALTFGWLCGELVRRIDGRGVGALFDDEIATPLGLDAWIGLPAEHETRVARLEFEGTWGKSESTDPARIAQDPLRLAVWGNPPLLLPGVLDWNSPHVHGAGIPGAGGIARVPSMARFFGCLARGGEVDGTRVLSDAVVELGWTSLGRGVDPLDGAPMNKGVGFSLQTSEQPFGPPEVAFGHGGAGGSLHGAWPTSAVGFSYAMNQMRDDEVDERSVALLEALYACVRN
jgi:CubicO group peptidase (beta-lactamase class C family)